MKSSMFGLGLSFSGNLATEVSLKRELTLNDSVRASKKLGSFKVQYKRPQHCWPTTPNIAECYIFRSFAHPVACCWELLH